MYLVLGTLYALIMFYLFDMLILDIICFRLISPIWYLWNSIKYLLQISCLAALAWEWKTHRLDSAVFTQHSLSKCSYIFRMTGVCCGLIHCLWGIHCIASLDHQTDRRVGRSTSPNANQKSSVCLLKPPRDDIHILYHPVDNTEAMRWEWASYFPCLKMGSSNITWHVLTFDTCSAFTHSAWRKKFFRKFCVYWWIIL